VDEFGFKGVKILVAQPGLPFLADEQAGDRAAGRVLASLVIGLVAGLLCGVIAGVVAISAFTYVASLLGAGAAKATLPINVVLQHPELAADSLRLNLVLIVMAASTSGGAALGFVGAAAKLTGRRFHSYFTIAPHFRWGLVGVGLVLNALVMAPLLIWENWGEISVGHFPLLTATPVLAYRVGFVIIAAGGLFVAALAEEVIFRGWLLRHVSAILRNRWVAIVIAALLFSAAHLEFAPAPFVTRAIMGLGLAWMVLRTGGVELSAGVHTANNLLLCLLVKPPSVSAPSGAGLSLGDMVDFAAIALIYLLIAEGTARLWPVKPRDPVLLGGVAAG
jgi:membrane protease YdiL (CAAX protease family)